MTRRTDQLKLGAFLANSGHHVAAWRHPLAQADASLDFEHVKHIAHTAERGKFDALFIADVVALWGHHHDALSRTARAEHFEPLTLMSALAAVTQHIGLIATATTTYNEPVQEPCGLFRLAYEGVTLRDNLGLPRPANRFTQGT